MELVADTLREAGICQYRSNPGEQLMKKIIILLVVGLALASCESFAQIVFNNQYSGHVNKP
jgi:hypothetical protein